MNFSREFEAEIDRIWPPDSTYVVAKVQAEEDLAFTLRDLRDPAKTGEVLTALYENQHGRPLSGVVARSLAIAIDNSVNCFASSTWRNNETGSTLAVMQTTHRALHRLPGMAKIYREPFAAATESLEQALVAQGFIDAPRMTGL